MESLSRVFVNLLDTFYYKCPNCAFKNKFHSEDCKNLNKINIKGDEFCMDQKCVHENCQKATYKYICGRCCEALKGVHQFILSDYTDRRENYCLSDFYGSMYQVFDEVDFINFMDDSTYINDLFNSFKFSSFKRLQNYLVGLVKAGVTRPELMSFLSSEFRIIDKNTSLKTVKNIRAKNSKHLYDLSNQREDVVYEQLGEPLIEPDIAFLNLFNQYNVEEEVFETFSNAATNIGSFFSSNSTASQAFTAIETTSSKVDQSVTEIKNELVSLSTETKNLYGDLSLSSDTFRQELQNLSARVDDVSQSFTGFIDSCSSAVNNNSKAISFFTQVVEHADGLLANIYSISQCTSYDIAFANVLSISSMLGLNKALVSKVVGMLRTERVHEQSKSNTLKLFVLGCAAMGKSNPLKSFTTETLFSLSREMVAAETIASMVESALDEWGLYSSDYNKMLKNLKDDLARLLNASIEYQLMIKSNAVAFMRKKFYSQFQEDFNRVKQLKNEVSGLGVELYNDANRLVNIYTKISQEVEDIRGSSGRRVEPAAFLFLGASGIGKTEFMVDTVTGSDTMRSFMSEYLDASGANDDSIWQDLVYDDWSVWAENDSKDMKYQDGYYGHEIHIKDDTFQDALDNDHKDWINYISSSTYITNQASLEEKGRPYEARLVLATCNKIPKQSKTIRDIKALQRRFGVFEVSLKPNCVVPKRGSPKDRSYNHLEFKYWVNAIKMVSGVPGTVVTKQEVMQIIAMELYNRELFYRSSMGMQSENGFSYVKESYDEFHKNRPKIELPESWINSFTDINGNVTGPSNVVKNWFRMLKLQYDDDPIFGTGIFPIMELYSRRRTLIEKTEFIMTQIKHWVIHKQQLKILFNMGGMYFEDDIGRIFCIRAKMISEELYLRASVVYSPAFHGEEHDNYEYRYKKEFTEESDERDRRSFWERYSFYFTSSGIKYMCNYAITKAAQFAAWLRKPSDKLLVFIFGLFGEIFDPTDIFCAGLSGGLTAFVLEIIVGGIMFLCTKLEQLFRKNKSVCDDCDKTGLYASLVKYCEDQCKQKCKIGRVWTTHLVECEERYSQALAFSARLCSCENACVCAHGASLEYDERSDLLENFKVSSVVPPLVKQQLESMMVVEESVCGCSKNLKCSNCSVDSHYTKYGTKYYNPRIVSFCDGVYHSEFLFNIYTNRSFVSLARTGIYVLEVMRDEADTVYKLAQNTHQILLGYETNYLSKWFLLSGTDAWLVAGEFLSKGIITENELAKKYNLKIKQLSAIPNICISVKVDEESINRWFQIHEQDIVLEGLEVCLLEKFKEWFKQRDDNPDLEHKVVMEKYKEWYKNVRKIPLKSLWNLTAVILSLHLSIERRLWKSIENGWVRRK